MRFDTDNILPIKGDNPRIRLLKPGDDALSLTHRAPFNLVSGTSKKIETITELLEMTYYI